MSEVSELKALVAQQGEMIRVLLDKLGEKVPALSKSSHEQVLALLRPPGPPSLIVRGCTSPVTGWKMDLVLDQNRKIIRFENYHHDGAETHIAQGGIVPDGMPIRDKDGQKNVAYRNWICTFYPKDNAFFVGKKFDATLAQTKNEPVVIESTVTEAAAE